MPKFTRKKSSLLKCPQGRHWSPSSSNKTTILAIYYKKWIFQRQISDFRIHWVKSHRQPTDSCQLVWFLLHFQIHFALIESKMENKIRNASVFAVMEGSQYMGHLKQEKVWESHRRGMSGGSKSHRQSLIEVWSALQLDCRVKEGDGGGGGWGGEMWLLHSCPPTQPPSGGEKRPPRTPLIPRTWNFSNVMQGLWRGNWGSSVAAPSLFACLLFNPIPKGEWLHRNC